MKKSNYKTTKERTLLALRLAVPIIFLVASALSAIIVATWENDEPQSIGEFIFDMIPISVILSIVYTILLLLALIIWVGIRRFGWNHWSLAVVIGFLAGFIPDLTVGLAHSFSQILDDAVGASTVGAPSAVIGLVLWRLSYRRVASETD